MGEAADTPRCPVLQRDWLGEGQLCSLTRHKSGRGGAGPPQALPLQPGRRERQHTAWPLNMLTAYLLTPEVGTDVEKVASTNLSFCYIKYNHRPVQAGLTRRLLPATRAFFIKANKHNCLCHFRGNV